MVSFMYHSSFAKIFFKGLNLFELFMGNRLIGHPFFEIYQRPRPVKL